MDKQSLLPTLKDHPYFILPESVGMYIENSHHSVHRPLNSSDDFNMHLVLKGKGYVEIDGTVHTLQKKGDAFLYFPYERQRYYNSEDDPWSIRWTHFYGGMLKAFLVERGFHRSNLWTVKQPKELEEAMSALQEEAEEYKLLRIDRLSTLTYAVLTVFMLHAVPLTAKRAESTDRIVKLLPAIQEQACLPFELDKWAEKAGVTSYYFCKLFRKATQMTPLMFVTLCRVQYAKQRLIETQMTVKEIAEQAGYPSASYFNKKSFWSTKG